MQEALARALNPVARELPLGISSILSSFIAFRPGRAPRSPRLAWGPEVRGPGPGLALGRLALRLRFLGFLDLGWLSSTILGFALIWLDFGWIWLGFEMWLDLAWILHFRLLLLRVLLILASHRLS